MNKKSYFVFTLVFFAMSLGAQVTTGNITFSATYDPSFQITLPAAYSTTIDDSVAGEKTWSIGTVRVNSNIKNWTLQVASGSSGYLVHSVDAAEKMQIFFSLQNEATSVFLVQNSALLTAWTSDPQPKTAKTGVAYTFSISFTPDSETFLESGSYSDTITFTIIKP
jgi:hypothetical protein